MSHYRLINMAKKEFIDSLWKLSNVIFVSIFQLIIFYILTRFLEPEKYGLYVLLITNISFLQIFSELGIPTASSKYLTEEVYKKASPRAIVKASILLSSVLGVVFTILCVLFSKQIAVLLKNDNLTILLRIGSVLLLINNFIRLYEELLKGINEFKFPTLINFIIRPIQLILIILFLALGFNLQGVIVAIIISLMFMAISYILFFSKKYYYKLKNNKALKESLRKIFFYSLPIALGSFAYYFYTKIDILLLSYFWNTKEIAVYNVADMIYQVPLIIVGVLATILSPIITREYTLGNHKTIQELFTRIQSFIFFLMLPFSIGLFFFSGIFIMIFFPEYQNSIILLKVLSPMIVLKGIGQIATGGFLISTGNVNVLAFWTVVGAILNFVFDLLLIPRWGALGAIITTSVIHSSVIIIMIIYLLKKLNLRMVISFVEAKSLIKRNIFE